MNTHLIALIALLGLLACSEQPARAPDSGEVPKPAPQPLRFTDPGSADHQARYLPRKPGELDGLDFEWTVAAYRRREGFASYPGELPFQAPAGSGPLLMVTPRKLYLEGRGEIADIVCTARDGLPCTDDDLRERSQVRLDVVASAKAPQSADSYLIVPLKEAIEELDVPTIVDPLSGWRGERVALYLDKDTRYHLIVALVYTLREAGVDGLRFVGLDGRLRVGDEVSMWSPREGKDGSPPGDRVSLMVAIAPDGFSFKWQGSHSQPAARSADDYPALYSELVALKQRLGAYTLNIGAHDDIRWWDVAATIDAVRWMLADDRYSNPVTFGLAKTRKDASGAPLPLFLDFAFVVLP